jgi:hypothetical protein
MTSTEMIQAFEVGYDIANLEGPGYEPEEILVLLNEAQTIEVLKEISVRRFTYISNLITNEDGALAAGLVYDKTAIFTPTEEYIGYISSKTKITRATFKIVTPAQWVENILIQKELSGKYITNDLNRPILLQPRVYEDEDRTITLIYDSLTTLSAGDNFMLEYVRRPTDIEAAVDSEVNVIMHERIVNTAVNRAKKVFNPNESGGSVQTDVLIGKDIK